MREILTRSFRGRRFQPPPLEIISHFHFEGIPRKKVTSHQHTGGLRQSSALQTKHDSPAFSVERYGGLSTSFALQNESTFDVTSLSKETSWWGKTLNCIQEKSHEQKWIETPSEDFPYQQIEGPSGKSIFRKQKRKSHGMGTPERYDPLKSMPNGVSGKCDKIIVRQSIPPICL